MAKSNGMQYHELESKNNKTFELYRLVTIYNQETFLALHIMQLAFYCYFLTKPIFLKAYFKNQV